MKKKKLKAPLKNKYKKISIFAVILLLGIYAFIQNFASIKTIDLNSKLAALSQSLSNTERNYYIDSINGDDTKSGTSQTDAWKTLGRLNTAGILDNGSTIYLKRNSVWHETLTLTSSSLATNAPANAHITIAPYGNTLGTSYPAPIIKGSKIIEGEWQALDYVVNGGKTKIWQTTITNFDANTDLFSNLFSTDIDYSQARYPDVGSIAIAATGTRSGLAETFGVYPNKDGIFRDSAAPYSSSLYVRRNEWHIQKHPVESFDKANNTITVGAPTNDPYWDANSPSWQGGNFKARTGYGYFYKNHISGLNLPGEWVFSKISRVLSVGLPSSSNGPSNYPELAFGTRNGIKINGSSKPFSITIKDIVIEDTGGDGIVIDDAANVTIDKVILKDIGKRGIVINRPRQNVSISNSSIEDTNLYGVGVFGASGSFVKNVVLKKNTLRANGKLETQESVSNSALSSISVSRAENVSILDNTISESGVSAISLAELNKKIVVFGNTISEFSKILNDAGAIYINGKQNSPTVDILMQKNKITGNLPGLGSLPEGSIAHGSCIYLDWATSNVKIWGNELTDCYSRNGAITVNSGSNNNIQKNTIMQSVNYPTIGFTHWHKNMVSPAGQVISPPGVTNNMGGNFVGWNTLCTLLTESLPEDNLTSQQITDLYNLHIPKAKEYLIKVHPKTMLPGGSLYHTTHLLPTIQTNTISDHCK